MRTPFYILCVLLCFVGCATPSDKSRLKGFSLICYLDPNDDVGQQLVRGVLLHNRVKPVIYGSVVYGVFVPNKDRQKARHLLMTEETLKRIWIEYPK
jgi:hypothetical protein